jgi:hypothetical protein
MTFQKSLCRWLPLLHRCVTLVKHFFKKLGEITMTKILIDEALRLADLIGGNVADELRRLHTENQNLRQALADTALDKKADNARALGLDYMEGSAEQYEKELEKPAQQEPEFASPGGGYVPATPAPRPAQQDIPDLIAGALGVSRGTAYDLMREALAEQPAPAQEPYGYFRYDIQLDAWVQNKESNVGVAFYTESPKREWVGLTDDALADLWYKQSLDWMEFARAIEAAHGITKGNT